MRQANRATSSAAIIVALLSLMPVAYLVIAGVSVSDLRTEFGYPMTFPTIVNTIALTICISTACLVLGVVCAFVVVRTDLPGRRMLMVLFAMPLAVPGFVAAYAAYSANLVFLPHTEIMDTFGGAAAALSLGLYPYVFLPCVVALRTLDPMQEDVGRSLGGAGGSAFWRVTVPQLRPALAGGVLIVALHVLAEYGALQQLGQPTLTTRILTQMVDYSDYRSARSLSVILVVLAIAVLLVNKAFAGRSYPVHSGSSPRPPHRLPTGKLRYPVVCVVSVIPVAAVGPTVVMTVRGLLRNAHLKTAWDDVLSAVANTAVYALWAALVATIVAVPVSWWVSRSSRWTAHLTERSVWVAHAIPNAILALALVFLATRLVPGLYKTGALLVLAYVILFLPLAVANQRVGFQAVLRSYDEVAASLGSRIWHRIRRIAVPLALPGLLSGALLVALDASKELTTTLLLIPFDAETLSTGLWATTNGESLDFTAAAPYSLLLVALGSIPVYVLVRRTLRFVR